MELALPVRHFDSYMVHSAEEAFCRSAAAFPDIRSFRFRPRERAYLSSGRASLNAVRFGLVESSGHTIRLNDELNVGVLLPIRGEICVDRGGTVRRAVPGQLLVVIPGERQTTLSPDYLGSIITVPETMLGERLQALEPDGWPMLVDRIDDGQPGAAGALHRTLAFTLQELAHSDLLQKSERIAVSAERLILDLIAERWLELEAVAREAPLPPSAGPRQLQRAEAYMRANYHRPIAMGDVAAHLGIGVRALQIAFQRHRGITAGTFLKARRMERARARLLRPEAGDSVAAVVAACGLSNPGRFAVEYRSLYGESPSATLSRSRP